MKERISAKSGIRAMNEEIAHDRFLLKSANLSDLPDKDRAKQSLEMTVDSRDPKTKFIPLINHIWFDQND